LFRNSTWYMGESLEEPKAYWSQPKVQRRAVFVFLMLVGVVSGLGVDVGVQGGNKQDNVVFVTSTPATTVSEAPTQLLLPLSLPISTATIPQSAVSTPARSHLAFKILIVFSLQTARIPILKFQPARTATERSTLPPLLLGTQSAAGLARFFLTQLTVDGNSPTTVPMS
jgi:hypothetical protein